jgi:hypothetical protein
VSGEPSLMTSTVFGIAGLPVFLIIVSIIFEAGMFAPLTCVCPARDPENKVLNIADEMNDMSFIMGLLIFLNCLKSKGKSAKINIFNA